VLGVVGKGSPSTPGKNEKKKFSIFSVMAGWIAETLFMLLFAYIAV